MGVICCRRYRTFKFVASCLLIVFLMKCYLNNTVPPKPSKQRPLKYAVKPRDFSLRPGSPCLPGFYTQEDLRPHLKRPPQDPRVQGADGKAFVMLRMTLDEQKEKSKLFDKIQFNQFASDRISLHRDLGEDTRSPDCRKQRFSRCPGLPTTSVIIVFHNEAWSTLMRTVYSVLHTAPAALLKEILLVDDASTDDHLKTRLDNYVQKLKIVRVLRQRERKGLITARLLGVQAAQGDVLTFLDSHCECFPGWLEPLLARIVEQPTAVVSPRVAVIDRNDLSFKKPVAFSPRYMRGIFNWRLNFRWEVIPKEEKERRRNETDPIRSPTFVGGLFSVSKAYFEHIGTYDDQMEFWGGENLEMSFRVWQCGGQIEMIPCSVVGHIYRKKNPNQLPRGQFMITRNLVRLAEVWMDNYKWIFYRSNKNADFIYKAKLFGDVSERRKLRQRLGCRDFTWYLNNVYPDAYVPDIRPMKSGRLQNAGLKCYMDVKKKNGKWAPLPRIRCSKNAAAQTFEYTSQQELRLSGGNHLCLQAKPGRSRVSLRVCCLKGRGTRVVPEQVWILTQTNHLMNKASGKCLTVSETKVIMLTCNSTRVTQNWAFV